MSDDFWDDQTALVIADPNWTGRARCAGMETELFFPALGATANRLHEALAVCRACPVRDVCLADDLLMQYHRRTGSYGVRGGMAARTRAKLFRQHGNGRRGPIANRGTMEPDHEFTVKNYRRHLYLEGRACDGCLQAQNADSRAKEAAIRERRHLTVVGES